MGFVDVLQDCRKLMSTILRALRTWWLGAGLLIVSSLSTILKLNPVARFLLALMGPLGISFVIADLVDRELREELVRRVTATTDMQTQQVTRQVEGKLRASFGLLDNATHAGLIDVLPARRDESKADDGTRWNERTRAAIRCSIGGPTSILWLCGISLLEFFLHHGPSQGEYFGELQEKAARKPLEVKILLLDPQGQGAQLRERVEEVGPFATRVSIARDVSDALDGIRILRSIASTEKNTGFSVETKLYSHVPVAYFVITDSAMFLEPYHFAPPDELRFWKGEANPCTGGRVPVFHFARGSHAYTALYEHFKFMWELGAQLSPGIVVKQVRDE